MGQNEAPKCIRPRALATRWGVAPATVYRALERGEIAHLRICGAITIPLAELERYERDHLVRGAA